MGESRDTHSDKCCDVCGAVGYEELVNTCSRCTTRRHFYCMRTLVRNKLEDWICELCLPKNDADSLKSGQTENVLDSSRKVSFDLRRQVGCKRQKAVETGKVKFLPTKEAIKLSSGLPKTAFPSNYNSGSKPVPANFTPSPSNRPFMGSKSNGPCFNPKKERRNPTFLQLGSVSVPRCRGVQISPSSRQHVVQIPNKSKEDEEKAPWTLAKKYGSKEEPVSSIMAAKEVKSKVDAKGMNKMEETFSVPATSTPCSSIINTDNAHVVTNKENVRKGKISDTILPSKELTNLHSKTEDAMRATQSSPSRHHANIISSGQDFQNVAEPENLNVPKTETWNRIKVSLYRSHAPSLYATWRGGFKFLDTATLGEYFGGFLARPPCRVHRKAFEFSKKMPPILQVNLLQQCHLQADILQNGCLDLFDIALYFFPADYMERSQQNYHQLFELMWMKNSVMTSYIDDVELLIFTSKQLHADLQDVFTRSTMDFFVGVFCRAKENRMNVHQELPSLVSYMHDDGNANTNSSEAVDMDIDMIGRKIVGIPDMVLSKVLTPDFNKQAAKEAPVSVSDGKFSAFSGDLNSAVQLISPESKQECCIESALPSKSTEKINSKFPVKPPSESSLGRLPGSIVEANMFPGFDMSKLDSSDGASKGKNVLDERGTMSQGKEENGCPGKKQVAFQVCKPQPPGSVEAFGVCRSQLHESTKDDSLQRSQNQNQINDPSAACLHPCMLGEGKEVGFEVKTEVHEDEKPFKRRALGKDESQIAGSYAVAVKAEVQEVVNDCTAVCPTHLTTGTKIETQIKAEEHEGQKSDEMREKGLRGSSRLSKDKSKTIPSSSNDLCTVKDKAERHVILPCNTETSLCSVPFASTMVKLSVAGRSPGNPGAASVGGLICDESGRWIVGYSLNLGICNCLAADLWALYQGMKFARDRGYKKVQVESDSAAAVVSLKKSPSLLDPNRALIESCRALINGEWDCKWDCKVRMIRKEENRCAEWLATHADGCQLGLSILNLPPLELIPLLEDEYKGFGEIC